MTVEANNELDRTLCRRTPAAGAGYLRLPVRGLFIEAAGRFASLGNGGPRLRGSRDMSDKTAGRDRHTAVLRGLALGHSEAARLFSCRTEIVEVLRSYLRSPRHRESR